MEKVFNAKIINYLRKASRRRTFNQEEFETGQTYIVQQPRADKLREDGKHFNEFVIVAATDGGHVDCKLENPQEGARLLSNEGNELLSSEETDEDLIGGGDANRLHINDLLSGLSPSQVNRLYLRYSESGRVRAPIRCILGPFPDEPIMAAVDKCLTVIGVTLGKKKNKLGVRD